VLWPLVDWVGFGEVQASAVDDSLDDQGMTGQAVAVEDSLPSESTYSIGIRILSVGQVEKGSGHRVELRDFGSSLLGHCCRCISRFVDAAGGSSLLISYASACHDADQELVGLSELALERPQRAWILVQGKLSRRVAGLESFIFSIRHSFRPSRDINNLQEGVLCSPELSGDGRPASAGIRSRSGQSTHSVSVSAFGQRGASTEIPIFPITLPVNSPKGVLLQPCRLEVDQLFHPCFCLISTSNSPALYYLFLPTQFN
jgi:hypothetical protein